MPVIKSWQKKGISIVAAGVAVMIIGANFQGVEAEPRKSAFAKTPVQYSKHFRGNGAVYGAIVNQRSDVVLRGNGRVTAILADDTEGARHQKFILALGQGKSVLVAHNIDLAPRVENLAEGDSVSFAGEYEWNEQGGVVHWTHEDPEGEHPNGYLRHKGKTYE